MILKYLKIDDPRDIVQIADFIPKANLSLQVLGQMQQFIGPQVKSIAIEYPYVDKDYRSTYYGFYAKRHRSYDRFCYRLHFFGTVVQSEENLVGCTDAYLGSMVLRPNEVTPMGRTLLSPSAIRGFDGYICEAEYDNHISGLPFTIKTFPHISQDTDVTVCAHAVCWMIARYYSEKHRVYAERTSFGIAEAVRDVSGGRMIPSRGLSLGQVWEVLTSIGFYPEIFVRELYKERAFFYDILYSYIESGIPVVAAMSEREHAVAIFGHGAIKHAVCMNKPDKPSFTSARSFVKSFIINDDNFLPFGRLAADKEGDSGEQGYCLDDVDAFVVPLYEKMYLNAENVLRMYPKFALGNLLHFPTENFVARVFMTSATSFKRFIREDQELDRQVKRASLELPMPQFIWIVEIASIESYRIENANYRWVIDATANQYEKYPFLILHDCDNVYINDRALSGKIFQLKPSIPIKCFAMFKNNLRRYR